MPAPSTMAPSTPKNSKTAGITTDAAPLPVTSQRRRELRRRVTLATDGHLGGLACHPARGTTQPPQLVWESALYPKVPAA